MSEQLSAEERERLARIYDQRRSPDKIRHDSRPAALAAIRALYKAGRGNPDYSAYRCGDHWHVGHDVVHFGKRISRALKAGKGTNTTFARNRRTAR